MKRWLSPLLALGGALASGPSAAVPDIAGLIALGASVLGRDREARSAFACALERQPARPAAREALAALAPTPGTATACPA